jgi:hypothetical protein
MELEYTPEGFRHYIETAPTGIEVEFENPTIDNSWMACFGGRGIFGTRGFIDVLADREVFPAEIIMEIRGRHKALLRRYQEIKIEHGQSPPAEFRKELLEQLDQLYKLEEE